MFKQRAFIPLEILFGKISNKFFHSRGKSSTRTVFFSSQTLKASKNGFLTGFTLIELVIVVGILAVIAAVVVIVINPAEYMKSSRDASRIADFATLKKSIGLYLADGKSGIGSTNIVYVSIPDSSATCANLGLPALPGGWAYQCSTSANYRKTDATGWIPIDFTQVSFGDVVQTLPIDPVNATSSGFYYAYVTGGSYQLSTIFESSKYNSTLTSQYYTVGTNSNLMPTLTLVASSTGVTMGLSTANGYAFITSSSLNLAPYLNKYIIISDGTNSISGFIKDQGSGETLGSELVANGNMETGNPPSNWVAAGTLTGVADERTGGSGIQALDAARTSQEDVAGQGSISSATGLLYKFSGWHRKVTGSTKSMLYNTGVGSVKIIGTESTSWTQFSVYGTSRGTTLGAYFGTTSVVGTSARYDDISLKQVLAPSATGATIVNTRGGGTYNWATNSGINPNAASFTVTISP